MRSLSFLLKSLPSVGNTRLVLSGLGVWVVWGKKADNSIYQTLLRFGGQKILDQDNQSLWFFQNSQLFPALARLYIWTQIHPEPVTIQVLPAKLILGETARKLSLSILSPLDEQKIEPGQNFEVWVHPDLAKQVSAFPGLSTQAQPHPFGMAPLAWHLFRADPNFSLDAELSWFFFVKPMRDPSNETFDQRWKQLYLSIKSILDRLGIRYIYQEGLLFFKLEGLALLATWCREILQAVTKAKAEDQRAYWPCLFMGINPSGLIFTDELPKKVEMDWNRLPPDMPHVPLSAALLLRDEFTITFLDSAGPLSLESQCQIALAASPSEPEKNALLFPTAAALFSGNKKSCFYCGLKNHEPQQCPSRQIFNWDPGVWDKLARLNFSAMAQAVKDLDKLLEGTTLTETSDLLQGEAPENIIARATFEISTPTQHRMLRLVWRSRGKEIPEGLRQLTAPEGEFIWAALENLRSGNASQAERMMQQAVLRTPKSYQPHILLGFIALETGNVRKAETHWNDAQRLCYTPLQHAYLLFLKARLKEIQDAHDQAHGLYREVQTTSPKWLEPRYRQAVCMVKKGFVDQAWAIFSELLAEDPHIFNRLLIDVELTRGRPFLLNSLVGHWDTARQTAQQEQAEIEKLNQVLETWFDPEDRFRQNTGERLSQLKERITIDNYVAFSTVIQVVQTLRKEVERKIQEAISTVKATVQKNIERLRLVQREIAGFPFPGLIRRIVRDANNCAQLLHSVNTTNLQDGKKFIQARMELRQADTILHRLQSRLRSIRIMRDGSLFCLFLGKNFLWLAVIGLIASVIVVPVLLHSLQKAEVRWATEWVTTQRWQVQRAVSMIMVIISGSVAVIWTSLRFDKQKQKYLAKFQKGGR